jgi:hypothetical protein
MQQHLRQRQHDGRRHSGRRRALASAAGVAGLAVLSYAGYVATVWYRYGRTAREPAEPATDSLLDRFMSQYEVAERHATEVAAPAALTYAAARAMDINRAPLVRAIFALRTLPARLRGEATPREPRSLIDETQALGWRVLAEVPDRVLVMGAVTQPWRAAPVFRGLPPEEFASFAEPGYVKIIWTLEAEPLGASRSRFVTRTRVCTTDADARARFRRYWATVSAGVLLIRRSSLGLVKADAERRFRASITATAAPAAAALH